MRDEASDDERLATLDAYLCELKEMQIRDGLHIFGQSPSGDLLHALLVALVRVSRGTRPEDASLIRALADDLGLGFDPLDCDMAAPWTGPKPEKLQAMESACPGPWRTAGDAIERLEALALALIRGDARIDPDWGRTVRVMTGTQARKENVGGEMLCYVW